MVFEKYLYRCMCARARARVCVCTPGFQLSIQMIISIFNFDTYTLVYVMARTITYEELRIMVYIDADGRVHQSVFHFLR